MVETIGSEADFEAALDYCMSFVTNTPATWKNLAKYPEKRLRFQNYIFEDSIPYTQKDGFGTAVLSPIYSVYQDWLTDNSSLVTLRGSIWNRIFLNLYENEKRGVERPRNGG